MKYLTEREILHQAGSKLNFPPLRPVRVVMEPKIGANFPDLPAVYPDLSITLAWRGVEREFLAEAKSRSTPRALDGALHQVQRWVKALSGKKEVYPMVIVPYLSREALDRLVEENVSGIDLCGNGMVIVPGEWFVYRTGAPNRYPTSAPIKNVFRGTSSLVARVFFVQPEYGSVNEVYEKIKRCGGEITLPTVSKALKALQEELVVGRTSLGAALADLPSLLQSPPPAANSALRAALANFPRSLQPHPPVETSSLAAASGSASETEAQAEIDIRLLDSERLLDLIERNYRKPAARRRLRGRFQGDRQEALARIGANADAGNIRVVGYDPSRYTIIPGSGIVIYTPSIETVLRGVAFKEDDRFPEFELVETDDGTIYFDMRKEDGFNWTSRLETYLVLLSSGKREREAAEKMREEIKTAGQRTASSPAGPSKRRRSYSQTARARRNLRDGS